MSYKRINTTDGVTIMNKDLYDNLQDGIEQFGVTPQMFGALGSGDETIHPKFLFSSDIPLLKNNIKKGVTQDCSDIFQQMLNSGNNRFYIPDGTYIFTKGVSIPQNVELIFSKRANLVMVSNDNLFSFLGSNNTIHGGRFGVADFSIFSKSMFYFGEGNNENTLIKNCEFYNYKMITESDVQNVTGYDKAEIIKEKIGGSAIFINKLNSYSESSSVCNTRFEDIYIHGFSVGIKVYIEDKKGSVFPWVSSIYFTGAVWFSRRCVELVRESKSSFLSNLYFDLIYQYEKTNHTDFITVIDGNSINYDCLVWDLPQNIYETICLSGSSNSLSSNRFNYINLSDDGINLFHLYKEPPLKDDTGNKFFIDLRNYGGIILDKELILTDKTSYTFFMNKLKAKNFKISYEVKVDGTRSLPHLTLYSFKGLKSDYHYVRDTNDFLVSSINEEDGIIYLDKVGGLSLNDYIRPSIIIDESSGRIFSGSQIPPNFSPSLRITEVNESEKCIKVFKSSNYSKYINSFKNSKVLTKDLSNKGTYRFSNPTPPKGVSYTQEGVWNLVTYTFDVVDSGIFNGDGFYIGLNFMDVNSGQIPGNISNVSIKNLLIEYI